MPKYEFQTPNYSSGGISPPTPDPAEAMREVTKARIAAGNAMLKAADDVNEAYAQGKADAAEAMRARCLVIIDRAIGDWGEVLRASTAAPLVNKMAEDKLLSLRCVRWEVAALEGGAP
jgi:hypothetical protein